MGASLAGVPTVPTIVVLANASTGGALSGPLRHLGTTSRSWYYVSQWVLRLAVAYGCSSWPLSFNSHSGPNEGGCLFNMNCPVLTAALYLPVGALFVFIAD